jgi:cob(I)alamin adenosyltransferase
MGCTIFLLSMKIYTKTGDAGQTTLFGGKKVIKSAMRLHAYGTIDELSALLGLILCEQMDDVLRSEIQSIQKRLFFLSTDLATPLGSTATIERIDAQKTLLLEEWIDRYDEILQPLTTFIVAGGTKLSALLHLARTVCRRAERWMVSLQEEEQINPECLKYMNRLSDYLFTVARIANATQGIQDEEILIRTKKE